MSENKTIIGAVNVTSSEIKCPGCGGTIGVKYDPESLNLTCPFCGLLSRLPQPGTVPVVQEVDFNSALQRASVNWGHIKKLIVCSNCGGQTLYDAEQVTGACPFCGSTSVTPAAENTQIMAPQSVIPFSISKEMAQQCFTNFLSNKVLVRSGVVGSKLENITGMYLPFWTFDSLTVSSYQATHTTPIGETKYAGVWNNYFDDLTVNASDRIRHPFIAKVQNFDFTKAVPYSPEYLAGIPAERYTVGLNEGWERTKKTMTEKIRRAVFRRYGINFHLDSLISNYYNVKFRYLLAPIYFATYRYKKNKFIVVINGQTGKTYCDAPTYIPMLVTLVIILFLAMMAIFGILMLLGELR